MCSTRRPVPHYILQRDPTPRSSHPRAEAHLEVESPNPQGVPSQVKKTRCRQTANPSAQHGGQSRIHIGRPGLPNLPIGPFSNPECAGDQGGVWRRGKTGGGGEAPAQRPLWSKGGCPPILSWAAAVLVTGSETGAPEWGWGGSSGLERGRVLCRVGVREHRGPRNPGPSGPAAPAATCSVWGKLLTN